MIFVDLLVSRIRIRISSQLQGNISSVSVSTLTVVRVMLNAMQREGAHTTYGGK